MSNLRNKLIEHIEAYAVAKSTNNVILVSLATNCLLGLIDSLELSEAPNKVAEDLFDDFSVPGEPEATPKARPSRKTST